MKKRPILAIAVTLMLCASNSFAECVINEPPAIPDGATATDEQMRETLKLVKEYTALTQEYFACLESESKGKQDQEWVVSYNKQTEKLKRLASDLSKQYEVFKSK
ncbi:MAG TPA: hypothetical protein DCS87_11850 [Rheinheimera sp.]|nr:hypothetical protein [Rheinheimera sp.]